MLYLDIGSVNTMKDEELQKRVQEVEALCLKEDWAQALKKAKKS